MGISFIILAKLLNDATSLDFKGLPKTFDKSSNLLSTSNPLRPAEKGLPNLFSNTALVISKGKLIASSKSFALS